MTKQLQVWIDDNQLDIVEYINDSSIVDSPIGLMLELQPINEKHFDKKMNLIVYEQDGDGDYRHNYSASVFDLVRKYDIKYFIYRFSDDFFYTKIGSSDLIPLKYVGEAFLSIHKPMAFLGIHGRYEQMNGSRDYADWCKKASFMKIDHLAICEEATLAGILQFQIACKKANIKSTLGYTAPIQNKDGDIFYLKLYVETEEGWRNLLRINKVVNIDNNGYIEQSKIEQFFRGLTVVIVPDPFTSNDQVFFEWIVDFVSTDRLFFQITTNEYKSNNRDRELLESMKRFIQESGLEPVLISDAYCLDYEDTHLKKKFNSSAKKYGTESINHYFRSTEELYYELEQLFGEDEESTKRLNKLFSRACKNSLVIAQQCQFQVDLKSFHLPQYEMTSDEAQEFTSNEELFDFYVQERAMQLHSTHGKEIVEARIKEECTVIKKGGFVDYFLILWDIIRWCESKNLLTGVGRGSAGGSLVAYCLGIIKLNPLDYGLLFERFLNEGRLGQELPDIDTDFNSERRDEVIAYMKERYGEEYVCRVGTYTTLQLKGLVKDLGRGKIEAKELNLMTQMIESENNDRWEGIFKDAARKHPLKIFIQDNVDLVMDCRIGLNSIKSSSQHACATIIVPKANNLTIFEQIPIRKDDKGMLISEWEGEDLAKAGFLKEDILSTKQMNKINEIFDLVKINHKVRLTLENIPKDDPEVYRFFREGYCQDVFHFGSSGLTEYLKKLQPVHMEDLIAAIALYRPGAMIAEAHVDYVKFKNGEEEPHFDYGLREVTKETYGLYAYQEQIMKACQVLGGFSLVEADGIRKAMGKKIKELMDSYKQQFIEGAILNGCPEQEAHNIWDKLEVFSGYGFNKSHAAAYAITGYICNWLKVHYPMEFWTIAFTKGSPDDLPSYISEIEKTGHIEIVPPDVNRSSDHFVADFEKEQIVWAINKIRQCGPSATQAILEERNKNGKFFSLEEFLERVPSSVVKSPAIINLILSGAFDEIHQISNIRDRSKILKEFFTLRKKEIPEEFLGKRSVVHWELMQMELSKLGTISYKQALIESTSPLKDQIELLVTPEVFMDRDMLVEKTFTMICGIVTEVKVRVDKYDRSYADITINCNNEDLLVRIFADIWEGKIESYQDWREKLQVSKGRILFITGIVSDWGNMRNLQTVTKAKQISRTSRFEIF